jgi:hypothetical protein
VELRRSLDPSTRLKLVPAATRMLGSDLLVNAGGAAAPVRRIEGTGPELWFAFERGLTIAEAAANISARASMSLQDIEAIVLQFATALVDADLAVPVP